MIGSVEVLGTPALLEFLREMISHLDAREGEACEVSFERGPDNARLIAGFVAHCVDLARGILALYAAGVPFTATRLIRGSMECAISAAWLAARPEETSRVYYTGAINARTIFAEAKRFERPAKALAETIRSNDEVIAALTAEGPIAELSIMDQYNGLVGGPEYYVEYRLASLDCHPTPLLAGRYMEDSGAGPIDLANLRMFPTVPSTAMAEEWLGQEACMLAIALIAYEAIQVNPRHMQELKAAARRLGISGVVDLKRPRAKRPRTTVGVKFEIPQEVARFVAKMPGTTVESLARNLLIGHVTESMNSGQPAPATLTEGEDLS